MTITSANGIMARLYGPLTRSENSGSLSFVDPQSTFSRTLDPPIPGEPKENEGPGPEACELIEKLQDYFLNREWSLLKLSNQRSKDDAMVF